MRADRPQPVRTERKIEEVAMLVRANRYQSVEDLAAAAAAVESAMVRATKLRTDDLNMSLVTQHSVPHTLTQDQRDNLLTI